MDVADIVDRVQGALERRSTDCPMEEVAGLCPELTWNQVFLAIDYLSRTGKIRVTLDPGRTYKVRTLHQPTQESELVAGAR